jgi:mercuric ion binding protein
MYCPACPITVQKSLIQIDGVQKAEANLKTKQVIVVYDPKKVQISSLTRATENVGYPSTVIKTNVSDAEYKKKK